MDLRQSVLRYRAQTGQSGREFGRACGVHPNTIVRVEAGKPIRQVTAEKIKAYLEANE